jgi:hypothetical protein
VPNDEPIAGRTVDPDGREVVLPARIWEKTITRDHREITGHLDAVLSAVARPDHAEADSTSKPHALLPARDRSESLAAGGRSVGQPGGLARGW